MLPEVTFFCDAPMAAIRATADPFLMTDMIEYREELDEEIENVLACLRRYPDIFTQESLTKDNFKSLYAQVCTRCFGWGLP